MKLKDFFINKKLGKSFRVPFKPSGVSWESYWTKLTFDDIVNVPVADASSVSDWNTFFDLPAYGTPFTAVAINGNEVILTGGSGITLKRWIFSDSSCATSLLKFEDKGCVIDMECEDLYTDEPESHTIMSPFLHYYENYETVELEISFCVNLTEVIFTSITNIGVYAFGGSTSLASITIPNTVTNIGTLAFFSTALTSIVIPDSVTSIGESVFQSCSVLTSVILSNNITSISNGMFEYCDSLTEITIPENVTNIGWGAFWGTSLTEITIPKNVTNIGHSTFPSSLMVVNMYPIVAPTQDFSFAQNGATLHIVADSTGYDVSPWNNTFYFASVVQDL